MSTTDPSSFFPVGIHVQGFARGEAIGHIKAGQAGAEATQIFASSPRQWRLPDVDAEQDEILRTGLAAKGIGPLFIHAPYLVNLASPTQQTRRLSETSLRWTLGRARSLGAAGVVVHAGHTVGGSRIHALRRTGRIICRLLDGTDGPKLLIELTAGGTGAVASTFGQAAEILDACDGHPSVGLCLDTCHLHAAGYDLTTREGAASTLNELDEQIGVGRLALIHPNDSRDPRGSKRDRHEHVGRGHIGASGFRELFAHPAMRGVPMVAETPGEPQDDRRNVSTLKSLRRKALSMRDDRLVHG